MSKRSMKTEIISISLLIICTVVIFSVMAGRMVEYESGSDYYAHAVIAHEMVEKQDIITPHFLYQLLLITVKYLTGADYLSSGAITITLLNIFAAAVIYKLTRNACGPSDSLKPSLVSAATTLSLLIATPILALFPFDGHAYFGYIGITVHHNPTITALKPLAVILFFSTVEKIFQPVFKKSDLILFALLSIMTVLTKPSFIICFLPMIVIVAIWRLIRGGYVNISIALSILVPSVAVLIWQFYVTYGSSQSIGVLDKSSIILAPFQVMSYYSQYLFLKFLLSIAFPLVVYILFFKNAVKDKYVNMSWFLFSFGALYTYFVAESGPRMYDANFWWSGQICLFILFVASSIFFIEQVYSNYSGNKAKINVCFSVYLLHVLSGIFFYYTQLRDPNSWW